MPYKTKETKEVQKQQKEINAPRRKQVIEKAKTAVIYGSLMLGFGFFLGNHYAANNHAAIQSQVNQTVRSLKASASLK